MPTPGPRFPARFDPEPWDEDLAHCTETGRKKARTARRDYEANGIPASHLKRCETQARDGTSLPQCFKVYVPHPDGKWGIVFRAITAHDRPQMEFLAFGVRHHPRDSRAQTVYNIAHRRLHSQGPTYRSPTRKSRSTDAPRR